MFEWDEKERLPKDPRAKDHDVYAHLSEHKNIVIQTAQYFKKHGRKAHAMALWNLLKINTKDFKNRSDG